MTLKKYLKLIFLIIQMVPGPELLAQYPFFRNFTTKDGLISNKIYNILEDRQGFIWICTDRGVSKYDGVEFTNFTSKDGLPDNEVLSLFEDKAGRIWFNSFSTEPSYYYSGKIYHSGNDSLLLRIKENKPDGAVLSVIVQDNNSLAFLIKGKNIKILVGADIEDIPVNDVYPLRAQLLQNILIRTNGQYYIVSPLEIYNWKPGEPVKQTNKHEIFRLYSNFSQAPEKYIYGLRKGNGPPKIVEVNVQTMAKRYFPVDNSYTNMFIQGGRKILTGDNFYSVYDSLFTAVEETDQLPFSFERILIDKKGNKWFGTFDQGIYLMRKNAPVQIELPQNLNKGILSIEPYNKALLLKTEKNGLIAMDTSEKSRILFIHPLFKRIRGFANLGADFLVGTDGGIFRLKKGFSTPLHIHPGAVKDMESGTSGEVLIGTAAKSFFFSNDSLQLIFEQRTTAICALTKEKIWLGGLKGIHESVRRGDTFITVKLQLDEELDNSRIVDIKKDKAGNIWVATDQNGIFFCPVTGKIVRFSHASPVNLRPISDICLDILIADDGKVWMATMGGVIVISYHYEKQEPVFQVRNYSVSEGMPGIIITSIAFWNGQLVVSTPEGLYKFKGFSMPFSATGRTVITQVNVNGRDHDQSNIILPYDQNNLVISYASSFINSGVTYLFRYRVRQLSMDWVEAKSLEVSLLGLRPGKYTFEIAALNSLGQAGEITTLHFTILTPWFRQWWFILLVSGVILLSVIYYLILVKEKISLSKNLTLLRLRILRAQMNPHFVFNALSNIQRLVYIKDFKEANTYIGTLASIMRKSIDYSGKEFIQLDKELEYTESYLEIEKLRFGGKFDYHIILNISDEEMPDIFVPPLLLQPLVENAIKHAFKGIDYKGELTVTIGRLSGQMLRYTVQDNGKGFDISKISLKDSGLGIAKERVGLLYKGMRDKGVFTIRSQESSTDERGTTIIIDLPILKD